jgi:hypothetical protein
VTIYFKFVNTGAHIKHLFENPEEKRSFKDPRINSRIIIKWILKQKYNMWIGFKWLGTGSTGEFL